MMGKPYSQYGVEPLMTGELEELRLRSVVVCMKSHSAHFYTPCTCNTQQDCSAGVRLDHSLFYACALLIAAAY